MRIFPAPLKSTAIALVLCLAAAAGAFAAGGVERSVRERLKEAEALIDERRYNDAILLLTQIVKQDPETFDSAEKLMQRIRSVRDVYNDTYQELLGALFVDNDLGRALDLIRTLQDLDPNPSAATARALQQARLATELVYNLNRFREIMNEARRLLVQKRYRDAVDKYLEGFELSRESFESAGYGNIVVDAVRGALERLEAAIPAYFAASENLDGQLAALKNDGTPAERLAGATGQIGESLETLARELAAVGRAGAIFRVQNTQVMEAIRGGRPDLFLFFATRLVFGREDEPPEGIAAALEAVWNVHFAAADGLVTSAGDAALELGIRSYEGRSFQAARAALSEAERYYRGALELESRWSLVVHFEGSLGFDEGTLGAVRREMPAFVLTQEKLREIRDTGTLIALESRLIELEGSQVSSTAEIETAVRALEPVQTGLDALLNPWRENLDRYRRLGSAGVSVPEAIDRAGAVLTRISRIRERAASLQTTYFGTLALRRGGEIERRYTGVPERLAQAVALQRGREVSLEPVRDEQGKIVETPVRVEKFPAEALAIYRPLANTVEELSNEVRAVVAAAGASQEYLDKNPEMAAQMLRLREIAQELADLQSQVAARLAETQRDTVQAESYRREGLDHLSDARRSFDSQRYADARQSVERAQQALDNSLALQESSEIRRIRDGELQALVRRIVDEENKLVVREVRQLLERGKALYRQGDFNRAEQALLQAQRRWDDTNPGDNPEITLWLGFVRAAVSASTGREIPLTDPLYPEMSQLYNQALGEYQEGRRLLTAGNNRRAVERFNRAQEKLTQILKFFPYNQDARLLVLRIEQVRDPEAFKRRLDISFREAAEKVRSNPQEAYASLKDIQSLQPNFPGLERALYNAEVELGVKLPPPDPSELAEARRQYQAANAIWQQRRVSDYPTALDYVNRAIEANPDFREAIVLKDNLQVAQGAPSTILTSDDQRRLKQAEEEFLKGNYVIAEAILDDLLRKPQYRSLQQLVELKRRVQSRL